MFKENSTEEILKLISEAQHELLVRQNDDIYYKVTIAKFVNSEAKEGLIFIVKTLDDLVENIDEHIKELRK